MTQRSAVAVMSQLIGLVKPLTGHMVLAIIMGTIGHLLAAGITILGAYAVLNVLGYDTPVSLTVIFAAALVAALVRAVLRYAEQNRNHYIAFKLLASIRDQVFRSLRKLCPAKLEGRDKGDLISLITSDIELLEVFYAHTISPIFIAVIFSALMAVYIGLHSLVLGALAAVAYIVVGAVVPVMISRMGRGNGAELREKAGDLSAHVLDSLRGLPEVQQYGQGEKRISEMVGKSESLSSVDERMKKGVGINSALTNSVVLFFDLLMLFAAAHLCHYGDLTFYNALICTVAMISSFGPAIALAGLGSTLQTTIASGNRVLDVLEEVPETSEIEGMEKTAYDGASAKDVAFSYGGAKVLDGVDMEIGKDRIIGISGASGSGKSTFLKLLMRFWKVDSGSIEISGRSVEEINTSDLRDIEGYMTQEVQLFHDSIRNNLRVAKLDATDGEIEAACRKAAIHDYIMSLPQGYDTPVGELGDTLSGGERQRIGLARAFLHDSKLLLLDEPTSNLDSLNEAQILKSVDSEKEGRTVILVSHRQSTLRTADEIYHMEDGRLVR